MDWAKDSSPERTDDPNHNASASSGKGWMRTARIRTPKAYDEVRQALMKIEADLPPERRTEWGTWDGKVQDWHLSSPKKEVTTLVRACKSLWLAIELMSISAFCAWLRVDVPIRRI